MAETTAFTSWKYSHYFVLVELKEKKNIKIVPTSNIKKHLQAKHSSTRLAEKDPRQPIAVDAEDDRASCFKTAQYRFLFG